MNPINLSYILGVFNYSRRLGSKLTKMKGDISEKEFEDFINKIRAAEENMDYEWMEEIEAELEELEEEGE